MTDCHRCAILEEELRQLRAELDRRATVMLPPPRTDDMPSPRPYLAEDELARAFSNLDALLPTAAQGD